MEWAGLALSVVGTVSTFALLYEYGIRRVGARRLIGLNPKSGVDVVCTTGTEIKSKYGTSAAKRALAPEGELQGTAAIANALGRWYPGTEMALQIANRSTRKLDRDLVLIGGPSGNACSAAVLAWPGLDFVELNAPDSCLVVGDFARRQFDHQIKGGRPDRDLGLIVCGHNRWSRSSQARLLLFGGLTTYGTGAAADFFFTHIAGSLAPFNRQLRRAIRSRSKVTVIVLDATFNNGYLAGCRVIHWESRDEGSH